MKIKSVSTTEFFELTKEKEYVILDVRTPQEFNESHIPKAINIDFYSETFEEEIIKLDTSKTYLIYCRSGGRSKAAMSLMSDLKFERVFELDQGIKSWVNNGFPTQN
jgi:rhodanese-related sulfurtransferase